MNDQETETVEEFQYGTLEFAEIRKKKLLVKRDITFCPLRDGMCERACECFRYPKIINNGPDDKPLFEVEGGFCTAYMLVGPT